MTPAREKSLPLHELTANQLAEIFRQAEAGYPEEICGIVIGKPGVPETYQVRQVRNIANEERQSDPVGIERDAQTAYRADPHDQIRVIDEARKHGWDVVTLYHSHPDHDAYFSAMDRDRALWAGEPMWPGVSYLVVSVREGRACDARYFVWDATRRNFFHALVCVPTT